MMQWKRRRCSLGFLFLSSAMVMMMHCVMVVDAQAGMVNMGELMDEDELFLDENPDPNRPFLGTQIKLEVAGLAMHRWQLQPVDFDRIRDPAMRGHVRKFLRRPIEIKFLSKLLAEGSGGTMMSRTARPGSGSGSSSSAGAAANKFRAVVKRWDGVRLRGNWFQGPPVSVSSTTSLKSPDCLKVSYDEAMLRKDSTEVINLEVILPPLPGKQKQQKSQGRGGGGRRRRPDLPSLVYSFPVGSGLANDKAFVVQGPCSVTLHPKGLKPAGSTKKSSYDIGKTFISFPMGNGIIDPIWTRGRILFRKGRSMGIV